MMSGQLRNAVIAVAALFVANFCYDEYLFRAATHDVIVETFRATAAEACHSNAMTQKIEASESSWRHRSNPASLKLVIGKSNLDVYFWQIDSAMWNAKYKNPYMLIVADKDPSYILCEYDILHRRASVHRM